MLEHSPLVWAEISVTDMNRAVAFYQTHFDLTFKHEVMNDMEMSIAETANIGDPSFALLKHDMMVPSRSKRGQSRIKRTYMETHHQLYLSLGTSN